MRSSLAIVFLFLVIATASGRYFDFRRDFFKRTVLLAEGAQVQTKQVQTFFETTTEEVAEGGKKYVYIANICDPSSLANHHGIAHVNIAKGWDENIGQEAKIEVCATSACTEPICSNYQNDEFNGDHNCSFPYVTSLNRTIYIHVTAGYAGHTIWNVALQFVKLGNVNSPPRNVDSPRRTVRREFKYRDNGFPKTTAQINSVTTLQQIVPGTQGSVKTLDGAIFQISFCPNKETTTKRYHVDIVVTVTDPCSGIATFVCLPPNTGTKCIPGKSSFHDSLGTGINVISIKREDINLNDLSVLVVGWGDAKQVNNFIVSARIYEI